MRIALLGATGLVGREMMKIIESRGLPVEDFRPLASCRSAGSSVTFMNREWTVEEVSPRSFDGTDIALFSAGGEASIKWAPAAVRAGAAVIDNSSAWRADPEVPLVVPEINKKAAFDRPKGIIANPNCSTIHAVMALYPLHRAAGLLGFVVTTMQSVSGSGQKAIQELEDESRLMLEGNSEAAFRLASVYPRPIAFNALPQVGTFGGDGCTDEEKKMANESRKILNLPDLKVDCTCTRIPVVRGHSLSVAARFREPLPPGDARDLLSRSPGIRLMDDPDASVYPTPLDVSGTDFVHVGRIRKSSVFRNGLDFWISSDNIRKGAALNAVQIAEILFRSHESGAE